MSETDILAEGVDRQGRAVAAEEKLQLLARWLHHCHERARQRRQLGVLEPRLQDDIGVTRSEAVQVIEKPAWR